MKRLLARGGVGIRNRCTRRLTCMQKVTDASPAQHGEPRSFSCPGKPEKRLHFEGLHGVWVSQWQEPDWLAKLNTLSGPRFAKPHLWSEGCHA